jgi:hypothetical protein
MSLTLTSLSHMFIDFVLSLPALSRLNTEHEMCILYWIHCEHQDKCLYEHPLTHGVLPDLVPGHLVVCGGSCSPDTWSQNCLLDEDGVIAWEICPVCAAQMHSPDTGRSVESPNQQQRPSQHRNLVLRTRPPPSMESMILEPWQSTPQPPEDTAYYPLPQQALTEGFTSSAPSPPRMSVTADGVDTMETFENTYGTNDVDKEMEDFAGRRTSIPRSGDITAAQLAQLYAALPLPAPPPRTDDTVPVQESGVGSDPRPSTRLLEEVGATQPSQQQSIEPADMQHEQTTSHTVPDLDADVEIIRGQRPKPLPIDSNPSLEILLGPGYLDRIRACYYYKRFPAEALNPRPYWLAPTDIMVRPFSPRIPSCTLCANT